MKLSSIPIYIITLLLVIGNVFPSENGGTPTRVTVESPEETTVQVHSFAQQKQDPDVSWVSITTERKIIELLYNSGITVFSPLTRFQAYTDPIYHIKGNVEKIDNFITATIYLLNKKGDTLTSDDITGDIAFFRSIRNVIGETVMYALDVNEHSMKKRNTKKRPTSSNSAYALYLKAKMKLRAEQPDRAINYLKMALKEAPDFAMACWAISQIYKEKSVKDSLKLWKNGALKIDAAHPRWPYRDLVDKDQPLQDLLLISAKKDFKIVDRGLYSKHVVLEKHDLSAVIWVVDPRLYSITIEMQKKSTGSYSANFLNDSNTILAVNGGFFEMDSKHRLYPSGLIVRNGEELFPVTKHGGSGIFCIKNDTADIIWSKDGFKQNQFDFALQCGPVIVEHGGKNGVYNNDYRRLNRAAIGISEEKIILSIVTGNNGLGLSLHEFATFLLTAKIKGGAGCTAALNLDGGSSAQASFSYQGVAISVTGLWAINSAIVVKKKNSSSE